MKWETKAGLVWVLFFLFGGLCDGKYGEILDRCIGSKLWEMVKDEKVGFFCPLHRHFECFVELASLPSNLQSRVACVPNL
jgi:hypothetical protein